MQKIASESWILIYFGGNFVRIEIQTLVDEYLWNGIWLMITVKYL